MARNGDLIPKDHISAMEAFDIYRKTKRGPDSNEQPPQGTEEWKSWYKQQSLEIDADESALLQPFLSGELEALISVEFATSGYLLVGVPTGVPARSSNTVSATIK